jgi:hypothetical protein
MECRTASVRAVQQRDYCGKVTKKVSAEDGFCAERFRGILMGNMGWSL